ncbi:tyrosine-protein phosphatase [Clavibacter michiganensis]|uniref:tyrosine-protein phosphatase n=2 Tax=Clavibacter michiganensis TaxID=28447 RepID=UPI0009A639D1|nr:tyrosine-protein phosphatase [Clavibacter michiganensis]MBF4639001.1 tyrosine-protein phosphatase [Clavibacter michiganensis subsp. michiganensis]MDO4031410.1 tyrosine-protein phosphatase [Clavibacter michiganensis]MDO4080779.1 tyrosine-protein phosphatase [Clavibacter michiganensis]MDO4087110.1 tyrosine-protein phosphatase [Clavibacter michiganensis]MDO4096337.1 tyrosine-protein phosphatase [Clavibacter michiganensis]
MTIPPARRAAPARIGALTAAAAAVVLSVGIGAPAAHAAADPALQPAPTASDHLITDVPGLVNGRELGAFTGVDGRTVAASRLIRTESLDKITAAGAATLATAHHVDLVIDLRTPGQIQAKPDVPIPGAKTVAISMFGADGDYPDDTVMYRDLIDKGRVDAADPGVMISAYRSILQAIASHTGNGTILIHCSHGMDRTGTVIDLLDRILGVGSADILHDYLLSNTQLGVDWAKPALLQGTFESGIASRYAGMDSYIRTTLGVDDQEITALRAQLLVSDDAAAASITVGGVTVPLGDAAGSTGAVVPVGLPALAAGDVRVTTADGSATSSVAVDGRTVTVTVTAADGRTTRTYRVTAGLAAIALPGGSAPTAGGTVAFRAAGLTPGATYRVILHSTPTDVGSVTASSDGTASGTVTIPAGTDPGTHTLTLVDAQGQAVSDPATITVSAAAVSAITATATGARHAGPAVATGGTSVAADPWPGLALAALGLAGLAAIAGRTVARRRATMRRP